ncbi:PH domain-containing protein [Flavobacterium sp. LS1R49]|uniref:PH domain-containing protein n=1 Tax=Flavobacterium shii TaxID=2987687 RepID=A0A9X2Z9R9_9FLAO|nr:PH domain-containing protein [Flavobacterium shii]MCV9926090.1 PH domain-containing protein [Flavobacterium shii]
MKKYKSKIDTPLIVFLSIIFIPSLFKMLYDKDWYVASFMTLAILFILHLFSTTYYIITENNLIVKSGFLVSITVDIRNIKKMSETNTLLSSPALSFDRLEVLYNKFDTVVISPKDKQEFIQTLKNINPEIEIKLKASNHEKDIHC